MGKNQVLSIALILFVVIACVLGGTTYYFKKNADEQMIARNSAEKAIPDKNSQIENLTREVAVLKSFLGQETSALEEITVQYNEDMKLYVPEEAVAAPLAPAPEAGGEDGADGEDGAEGDADGEAAAAAVPAGGVAKPSYRTVLAQLAQKIIQQNELTDQIEKLEQQIVELKEQVGKAKEEGLAKGKEDTEKEFEPKIAALNQQIEELNGRLDSKDVEIKQQIADKKKLSKEQNRQKAENDELKKQNTARQDRIAELEKIEHDLDQPPQESKMGEIVYVNPRGTEGSINLGKKDRLTRGITFSVYEPNNMTQYGLKGTIEVLDVSNDREADVIIYNEDESDPIKLGDVIYTPTWSPGFEEHFAIAGFIDIDGDNQSDLDEVIRLIEQNGGIVDAYQKDDSKGGQKGKLTSQTSWIVLGTKPDEKSQQSNLTTYSRMMDAAKEFNTKKIQLNDLLRKMGYRPPADNRDFDVRPTTGSARRTSTGSVSELYREEDESDSAAPRREPPRGTAY